MKEAIRPHQAEPLVTSDSVHDLVLPLQSVTLGAEDQLLAAIIFSGAVCCYEGVRPSVRLCEVSPNNYARPAQSQSSRQIPSL